jgi:hypothetical protein
MRDRPAERREPQVEEGKEDSEYRLAIGSRIGLSQFDRRIHGHHP